MTKSRYYISCPAHSGSPIELSDEHFGIEQISRDATPVNQRVIGCAIITKKLVVTKSVKYTASFLKPVLYFMYPDKAWLFSDDCLY